MENYASHKIQQLSRCALTGVLGLSMVGVVVASSHLALAKTGVCPKTEAGLRSAIHRAANGTLTLSCASRTTILFTTTIGVSHTLTLNASGSPATVIITGDNILLDVTGSLTLNHITVSKVSSGLPVLIHAGATGRIKNSTFNLNRATSIFNAGRVTVSNPSFTKDSSGTGGTIRNFRGTAAVTNSTFAYDYTLSGPGGAINNDNGTLTVTGSTFFHNGGGAISNTNNGSTTVANSTFDKNFTESQGGAISSYGTLTVSDSTFAANSSGRGGAVYGAGGTLAFSNTTFSGNSANWGGGISTWEEAGLTVTNSTFANNLGGAFGHEDDSGPITMTGSIITGSPGSNCRGATVWTDRGYNLIDDDGGVCGLTAATDKLYAIPALQPLANNGGPTQTMALLPKSPATDAIPISSGYCPKTDQRGAARPDKGETFCDIGAFESAG